MRYAPATKDNEYTRRSLTGEDSTAKEVLGYTSGTRKNLSRLSKWTRQLQTAMQMVAFAVAASAAKSVQVNVKEMALEDQAAVEDDTPEEEQTAEFIEDDQTLEEIFESLSEEDQAAAEAIGEQLASGEINMAEAIAKASTINRAASQAALSAADIGNLNAYIPEPTVIDLDPVLAVVPQGPIVPLILDPPYDPPPTFEKAVSFDGSTFTVDLDYLDDKTLSNTSADQFIFTIADLQTPQEIEIFAVDSSGQEVREVFTIPALVATDEDRAPIILDSSLRIGENETATLITQAIDVEDGLMTNETIIGPFDYETSDTFVFTDTFTDSAGNSVTVAQTVDIVDDDFDHPVRGVFGPFEFVETHGPNGGFNIRPFIDLVDGQDFVVAMDWSGDVFYEIRDQDQNVLIQVRSIYEYPSENGYDFEMSFDGEGIEGIYLTTLELDTANQYSIYVSVEQELWT